MENKTSEPTTSDIIPFSLGNDTNPVLVTPVLLSSRRSKQSVARSKSKSKSSGQGVLGPRSTGPLQWCLLLDYLIHQGPTSNYRHIGLLWFEVPLQAY